MKLLLRNSRNFGILFFLITTALCCKKEIKKENIKVLETSRVNILPYYKDETFTPYWLIPNSKEEKTFHKIPDFEFRNQLGNTVSQKTFKDKIYITDFFFTTCPGICPKMTSNMKKLQTEFKNDSDILLLSHSVMPTTDTVQILKAYAENNNVINEKWHLVTGDKNDIYSLGRDYYFVENDLGEVKSIDDFLHTENFLLIDKNKHIRGIYNGLNSASIAQLIADVKTLKNQ